MSKPPDNPTLRGERYRRTHADSVKSILGHLSPPVHSRGGRFYNRNRWTLRVFVQCMCAWAKSHPKEAPTRKEIRDWVETANRLRVSFPEIVIANTPAHLPYSHFMALVGGAYHEALHSLLSCRRPLTVDEMAAIVIPRWEAVEDWSRYHWLVLDWANIVEDIRIEREGSRLFPGVLKRLESLQDLILEMEGGGEHDIRSHGDTTEHEGGLLDLLSVVFRDLGLGYKTEAQLKALETYKKRSPETFEFVSEGPLADVLEDSIHLGDDDTGCVRIALDAIIAIVRAFEDPYETNEKEKEPQGQGESASEDQEGTDPPDLSEGQECSYQEVAQVLLESADSQSELALLDNNTALEKAFQFELEDVSSVEGVQPWSPYDPSEDIVQNINPSPKGKGADTVRVDLWLSEVSEECSYLRARMSTIIRALEMTDVLHGSRVGSRISERNLVNSFIDISANSLPDRPYVVQSEKLDKSMAVALVLDESQSMVAHGDNPAKMMLLLADTFHRLGIPYQATGIRIGGTSTISRPEALLLEGTSAGSAYHRYTNVIHDVFKRFEEDFRRVRWRFANAYTVGGTPLADGIQYGLDSLNYRDEAHRVLLVVTDGKPNLGAQVIPWQLQVAKEAGVHVIGVGVGQGAQYVEKCFEHGVWDANFTPIPRKLLGKLNELVDLMALKRGRRMRGRIK